MSNPTSLDNNDPIDSNSSTTDTEEISSIQTEQVKLHPKSSNEFRAKWFIDNDKIHLCAKMQVFNIKNEKDEVNVVSLNPDKCSCADRKNCAHILAAKLSINAVDRKQSKKKCNLTQLRVNSRNKMKSSRKYRDNIV